MSKDTLRVVPLGGLGEIGKNMLAIEYGPDILIVDAGIMFPENDMWGVDLVIPDFGYLLDKKDRVRGIVLTHGHEDHIGALPYVLRQIPVPVYGTRLTLGLAKVKLKEDGLADVAPLHEVVPRQPFRVGVFEVECFRMNHSIPDDVGLAIRTPLGLLVHSGDFKFDHTPIEGRGADLARLAQLGGEGVPGMESLAGLGTMMGRMAPLLMGTPNAQGSRRPSERWSRRLTRSSRVPRGVSLWPRLRPSFRACNRL